MFEYDEGLITEAIRRELRRAGQVFYMHNRVESIASRAARLSQLFPEAQVGIAHGQMDEESLSDVWRSLLEGKIDILVCTTIIETGVDVSNANTLIIEDADRLGLSQLHQIRGRVGRSSRKAYAYFTYPKTKTLSEIASKRLSAIREFTEFGSGFRIAMRDLEIRGAGNILGAEQHGHMDAVGYDLYIRLLSAAVEEEKGGGEVSARTDCLVDVPVDAYIPEDYISSSRQRMEMYKRIASIEDEEDRRDVEDELTDRFGDIPTPAFNLIKIALLRNTACGAGIKSIEQKNGSVVIIPEKMDIRAWSACISRHSGKLLLSMGVTPYVAIRLSGGDKLLDLLGQVLAEYALVVRE
ncbi:MAG: TRCF domain-containing protein [Eubacteriales bacterium]